MGDRSQDARFQSSFYRDSYFKVLRGLLISVFIILLLIVAIIYNVFFLPAPTYYVTTNNGLILPLQAVN